MTLIILGEAGMGKSTLLEWISNNPDCKFCTAKQLINRHDARTIIGDAKVLVIGKKLCLKLRWCCFCRFNTYR
jgi:predicted ATPase